MELRTITSRQNPVIKHLARLARDKKYRLKAGEMVCEGDKMLYEALTSGVPVHRVLVRAGSVPDAQAHALLLRAQAQGAELLEAGEAVFSLASDVEHAQWLIFSCDRPAQAVPDWTQIRRAVLLDGIQDPGNLGTILRTADAFALDAVILCAGCTDPTAPKVVRATMGAAFRQPMFRLPLDQAVAALREQAVPVYAAALAADSMPLPADGLPPRAAVIIGNEGRGVSAQALALCDRKLIIPMAGRAESLNAGVATAILIWEMTKGDRP